MSTDMKGIQQYSLFSLAQEISVSVNKDSHYRILAQVFPWPEAAAIVNKYRAEKVDINNGRTLNLRAHIVQSINGWTDRLTEEMVRYHAGVRLLCGLEISDVTMDRTRIEAFRNCIGKDCAKKLNQLILNSALGTGFTGIEICVSDTTVQESLIAYPTEVDHMKNIAEKILGFAKKLGSKVTNNFSNLKDKAQGIFTSIRHFTPVKSAEVLKKKKQLSKKLLSQTQKR